jgi:hypothetical protein
MHGLEAGSGLGGPGGLLLLQSVHWLVSQSVLIISPGERWFLGTDDRQNMQ